MGKFVVTIEVKIEDDFVLVTSRYVARQRWQGVRYLLGSILGPAAIGFAAYLGGESVETALLIPAPFILVLLLLYFYGRVSDVFFCTREFVEISSRRMGMRWLRKRFATKDVKGLAWGNIRFSPLGIVRGLVFTASGKRYTTASHLSIDDADRVKAKCRALGMDVPHDPADTMLHEMVHAEPAMGDEIVIPRRTPRP